MPLWRRSSAQDSLDPCFTSLCWWPAHQLCPLSSFGVDIATCRHRSTVSASVRQPRGRRGSSRAPGPSSEKVQQHRSICTGCDESSLRSALTTTRRGATLLPSDAHPLPAHKGPLACHFIPSLACFLSPELLGAVSGPERALSPSDTSSSAEFDPSSLAGIGGGAMTGRDGIGGGAVMSLCRVERERTCRGPERNALISVHILSPLSCTPS